MIWREQAWIIFDDMMHANSDLNSDSNHYHQQQRSASIAVISTSAASAGLIAKEEDFLAPEPSSCSRRPSYSVSFCDQTSQDESVLGVIQVIKSIIKFWDSLLEKILLPF